MRAVGSLGQRKASTRRHEKGTKQRGSSMPAGVTVKLKMLLAIGSVLGLSAFAHASPQAAMAVESTSPAPMFRVTVISRTVQAVNYRHREGATDVDFAGTALLPSANGNAKVRSKRGTMEV